MKNEEMKTNEKELILETPIGPISVDLGQFAAIQASKNAGRSISNHRQRNFVRKSWVRISSRPQNTGREI